VAPIARHAAAAALAAAALPAWPSPSAERDGGLAVIRVDTRHDQLELYLADPAGHPWRRLDRLAADLASRGRRLVFAMNAGMFEPDLSPVGLFVAEGREVHALNLRRGLPGNFYRQPNGVFLLAREGPRIVESSRYARLDAREVVLATQSGPLLVEHGQIPAWLRAGPPASGAAPSRFTRNGVCVDGPVATFVIADTPLTLGEFARTLRDRLHCRDALYFDGAVSSLYDAATKRADSVADLGPIIAVSAAR
jgi:uncharacterized protein YigE (DUF2233 family)